MQRAVRAAVYETRISKTATCHAFRHSFNRYLLERGQDIRTIRKLHGHKDGNTTMIYTHGFNRGTFGVRSPVDIL